MNYYLFQPRMTKKGVAFTIRMDSDERECLISREALEKLSAIKNIDASDAEPMELFHAFEVTIDSVARRLAVEHAYSSLLVLRTDCFDKANSVE